MKSDIRSENTFNIKRPIYFDKKEGLSCSFTNISLDEFCLNSNRNVISGTLYKSCIADEYQLSQKHIHTVHAFALNIDKYVV